MRKTSSLFFALAMLAQPVRMYAEREWGFWDYVAAGAAAGAAVWVVTSDSESTETKLARETSPSTSAYSTSTTNGLQNYVYSAHNRANSVLAPSAALVQTMQSTQLRDEEKLRAIAQSEGTLPAKKALIYSQINHIDNVSQDIVDECRRQFEYTGNIGRGGCVVALRAITDTLTASKSSLREAPGFIDRHAHYFKYAEREAQLRKVYADVIAASNSYAPTYHIVQQEVNIIKAQGKSDFSVLFFVDELEANMENLKKDIDAGQQYSRLTNSATSLYRSLAVIKEALEQSAVYKLENRKFDEECERRRNGTQAQFERNHKNCSPQWCYHGCNSYCPRWH